MLEDWHASHALGKRPATTRIESVTSAADFADADVALCPAVSNMLATLRESEYAVQPDDFEDGTRLALQAQQCRISAARA